MKPAKGSVGGAVDRPDPRIRFYLFHGADEAGSRALAQRLLAGLKADKHRLSGPVLKSDPALLADEAGAIAMFGGPRLLWLEPAGDEICAAVQGLLNLPVAEHPTVAVAGTLRKTSTLLKLAEAHPLALAHVSYLPEGRDADRLVLELGRREGLRIERELATRIAAAAGNDQAIIAQELRKFALFLQTSPENPQDLSPDVVDALGAEASESDTGRAGDLALSGDLFLLSSELERLETCGIEPIPATRALQRRLLMLVSLRGKIEAGQTPDAVTAAVFWKDRALIAKLLARWTGTRLAQALERVAKLERQLLLSPVPDRAAFSQELIGLARAASRPASDRLA